MGNPSLGASGHTEVLRLPCRAQDTWVFLLVLGLTPVAPSHPLIGTELVVGSRSNREVALLTHTSQPEAPEAGVHPRNIPGPQRSTGVIKEMGTGWSHPGANNHLRLKRSWGD